MKNRLEGCEVGFEKTRLELLGSCCACLLFISMQTAVFSTFSQETLLWLFKPLSQSLAAKIKSGSVFLEGRDGPPLKGQR